MLIRLSQWFLKISTGWAALAALVFFLFFTATVLPNQNSSSEALTSAEGSPDLSFFYTPAKLYAMADAFGEEGRRDYIIARFTFDVVWPIVYTAFLTITLSWLSAHAFAASSRWRWCNLLPVCGALFDYLENITASLVMARYPLRTPGVDVLASLATPVKWMLLGVSFGLLVAMGIKALINAVKVKK